MPRSIIVPASVKTFQDFVNQILVPVLNDMAKDKEASDKRIKSLEQQIADLSSTVHQLTLKVNRM